MYKAKSAILVCAWLLGAATPVFGANADISVTVAPVPNAVSISRNCTGSTCALTNYAAYEISVVNNTTNVINQVVLSGSTDVKDVTPDPNANFVESIPSGLCVSPTTPADNTIQCNVGQVRASTTFVVIFKSPPSTAASTYQTSPRIDFNYMGTFSMSESPRSPAAGGTGVFSGVASTGLITTDDVGTKNLKNYLETYIPTFGLTFYTGAVTATGTDQSTTKIKVEANQGLKTATIDEDIATGGQTNDTLTTNTTTIKIPSSTLFSQPATVELRRDSTTIRVFSQINRVPLFYSPELGEPVDWSGEIPSCTDSTYYSPGSGPSATYPICVAARIPISKKTAVDPEEIGDWLFILKALQNGKTFW